MITLDDQTINRIKDYHEYHGDENIKIAKVIRDGEGYEAVLVRVNGDTSCIDLMDMAGDFFEFTSCNVENEGLMINEFEGN